MEAKFQLWLNLSKSFLKLSEKSANLKDNARRKSIERFYSDFPFSTFQTYYGMSNHYCMLHVSYSFLFLSESNYQISL